MLALALALLLAPLAVGHSRAEGKARFALDDTGRVDIVITLAELDMPELCDVDLSVRDAQARAERLRKLDACVHKDLPRLLRVRADERACPVLVEGVNVDNATVAITALASCAAFPERLVVDWGLFAGKPLDHVAVATIEQPHAEPKLVMLSKRSSKLVLEVARPVWPQLLAALALVVLVALVVLGIAAVTAARRRRAHT